MNVNPSSLSPHPLPSARPGFEATVSDQGVHVRNDAAPAAEAEPFVPVAASTSETVGPETRPPTGQSSTDGFQTGVYNPRGRASLPPAEVYQGRLLDVRV